MKAILFDFDGVIIDSETVIKAAFTLSFRQVVGIGEPPIEEYFRHMGDSFDNIMRKMSLPLEMKEPFRNYSRQMINLVSLHKGVLKMLNTLKGKKIKMAIITGKDGMRTREILNRLNISDYFETIIASDEVSNPKPHPEPIFKALEILNIDHNDAVMVGDAPNDLISAKRAGVKSCAVTWGTSSKAELLNEKPNYLIEAPEHIIKLFCPKKFEIIKNDI